MGRAETLAAVREKYPQYADMADDALGSALAAKFPEYADLAALPADTRNAITRGYEAVVKPITSAVTKVAEPLVRSATRLPVAAARAAQGEPISQVIRYPEEGGDATAPTRAMTEMAIPQTPLDAGMMLGTGGAGYAARGLTPGLQALSRITGGVVGGTIGDVAEGGSGGRGALAGGAGAAAGEVLGAAAGRLRAAIPGGKRAANEADVDRVAGAVAKVSPELADVIRPRRAFGESRGATAGTVREMAEGRGQATLGAAKERAVQGVEQSIPAQRPDWTDVTGKDWVRKTPAGWQPARKAGEIAVPALKQTAIPLRAANEEMSDIGARAFSRNPLDRTAQGLDQRRLYGQVSRDIVEGIEQAAGPQGRAAFEAAQSAYNKGLALTRVFQKAGVLDNDGFLNMPKLQRVLNDPKQWAALQRKLGPDDARVIEDAVYRGAGRGDMDRMASGKGGPLDALMQVLRGTNTGFSQTWRVPLATALPNLGSQYVGRNPLALHPFLRTLIDLTAQRGIDEARR